MPNEQSHRTHHVREVPTTELGSAELGGISAMLLRAYGPGFSEDDWAHTLGGVHFLVEEDGRLIAHAAVVERTIAVADMQLHAGYVEAVATDPPHQRRGLASLVMRSAGDHIRARYELGALSTGEIPFYERLGWEPWRGPTYVNGPTGPERTADEDGGVMILRTPSTPTIDLTDPITCDWRSGDVW